MYDDSFNSNPTYHEHKERVKEVTNAKNSVRREIAKQPAVAQLEQKTKDLRFDINESQKTLSDLLADYKEQTGATQLELFDGRTMELVTTVKLVRVGK
jgi:predicted RNase H-like nuclease (RuvC/YqgF family)